VGFPILYHRSSHRSLHRPQKISRKFLSPRAIHVAHPLLETSNASLLEAYTIGTIVTFYDTTIVLEALLITVGLFAGLTLFTLQSKWDFSGMGPFLFGGLWAFVLAGFVMIFFPHNG
jgi:FtsH-binding integral membrane protein